MVVNKQIQGGDTCDLVFLISVGICARDKRTESHSIDGTMVHTPWGVPTDPYRLFFVKVMIKI